MSLAKVMHPLRPPELMEATTPTTPDSPTTPDQPTTPALRSPASPSKLEERSGKGDLSSEALAKGEERDLLALIDPVADAVKGTWIRNEDGSLDVIDHSGRRMSKFKPVQMGMNMFEEMG